MTIFERVGEWFSGIGESIQQFFITHGGNPFLWVGIILLGLVVFELTHRALKTRGE